MENFSYTQSRPCVFCIERELGRGALNALIKTTNTMIKNCRTVKYIININVNWGVCITERTMSDQRERVGGNVEKKTLCN